jgi:two-component system sensor histidine kinase/response regulator
MKALLRRTAFGLSLAALGLVVLLIVEFRYLPGYARLLMAFNLLIFALLFLMIRSETSKRETAEKILRKSEAQFRQLVQHAGDIIYRTDKQGRFTFINETVAQLMGYQPDELLGRHFLDPVAPSAREQVAEFYRQQFAEKTPNSFHAFQVLRKDGSEMWVAQTVQLILENDQVVGAQGVARDATERVQLHVELGHARDAALESTRLKSEFLANMSHEIRTPMNGVIGMTSLLAETKLNDEQRHLVDGIRQSGDALLNIINDILDFSKLEARKVQLETLDFELGPFIESIIQVFVQAAETKNIELTSIIEPQVPASLGADSTRLRQILINLLGNAVKFTENGEVTLKVRALKQTRSGLVCRFEVTDTGIGISEEGQQRLFQPFVQADGTTTRRFGGSGLGLTISKHLVELMGGEIGVASRLGEGSTFWFDLPGQTAGARNVEAAARTDLEGLRALIVDDKPIHREALRKQLTAWRLEVAEAHGFTTALNRLQVASAAGRPFDLALIDHDLDGREGLELARDIRKVPELASVRLILLSTFAQRPAEEVLTAAGVRAVITKPVRHSVFFDCLLNVMREPANLHQQPDGGASEPADRTQDRKRTEAESDGLRILVVEDNPINQEVAKFQVAKLGYAVDVVNDGVEALSMLDTADYALVLMDCHMPVMDGFEATRRIRERQDGKQDVPIIAVTASGTGGERAKCLASGMNDFLLKPFRREELSVKIKKWISASSRMKIEADDNLAGNHELAAGLKQLEEDYGKEMLSKIVQMFIPDAEKLIGQIEEAIKQTDSKSLEESAHRLKGGAANVGATEVSKLSAELETCGETSSLGNAEHLLNSLRQEWRRVRPQLASYN